VYHLLVVLKHNADQQEIERYAVVLLDMKETPTQAALLTLALSLRVELTLSVREMVTELSASVPKVTVETHL